MELASTGNVDFTKAATTLSVDRSGFSVGEMAFLHGQPVTIKAVSYGLTPPSYVVATVDGREISCALCHIERTDSLEWFKRIQSMMQSKHEARG